MRPADMQSRDDHNRYRHMAWHRARSGAAALVGAIALAATLSAARAQDAAPVIGTATLPRDLSPWGMFLSADPVVKAVLIGLAFASVLTWTVWLAKTIEILLAKRRAGGASCAAPACSPPSARPRRLSACSAPSGAS